jgi:methyl-accepting chemotaxis protein
MVGSFQEGVNQIIKGVRVNADLNATLDEMLGSSTTNIDGIIKSIKQIVKMIEQTSEATMQQAGAYENIDESMGSINQAFYEILDGTDLLVKNGDDILKFTGHLQAILTKFDKKDHLQIES